MTDPKYAMPGFGPGDIHPATPYAFLRAAIAEDHQGLSTILATSEPAALACIVGALAITLGEQAYGSSAELDAYLDRCQQAALQLEAETGEAGDGSHG